MSSITQALFPVVALILAGFLIQRTSFLPDSFWPSAEKLTYFLLMPAMLIHNLAGKRIGELPWLKILLTVEGAVLVSAALVLLWWVFNRHLDAATFTSVFQGGVRFNTFVALALAENLYGTDGLLLAALAAGFMILLINVLCVSAFSLTVNHGGRLKPKEILRDLSRNPLILGCVVGVGLNAAGIRLPLAIDGVLALGGKAAFPMGLLAVGAAYRAGNLARHWQPLLASCTVQFLCKPVLAWALATSMGLSGIAVGISVLLFSVPTAPSAYILSRQMGGDYDCMASIITVQTCLSFVTLPLTLLLFQ
jgi:malonate transporter and related proteins